MIMATPIRMRHCMLLFSTIFFTSLRAQDPVIQGIIDAVNIDSMVHYVEEMSGEVSVDLGNGPVTITSRHSDNAGNLLAQEYYVRKFTDLGYSVTLDAFNATGTNVIATKTGSVHPDEVVILCAHFDALPAGIFAAPAADDDGSGCGAVLEAARILRDIPFERTVVFALWDQEEQGKIGSIAYANAAAANDENIHAVVNMDAIAYDGNGDTKARVHVRPVANSPAIADTVFAVLDRYDIAIDLLRTEPGALYSDHASFWSAGYGAVLVIEEFTNDGNPQYHTINDRVQYFDVPYYEKLARLSIASAASLAVPYDAVSGIRPPQRGAGLSAYVHPNPAEGPARLWVEVLEAGRYRIELVDHVGRPLDLVHDAILAPGKHDLAIDLGDKAPGAYAVLIRPATGPAAVVKLLRVQ